MTLRSILAVNKMQLPAAFSPARGELAGAELRPGKVPGRYPIALV
jgi:hypothetical protein